MQLVRRRVVRVEDADPPVPSCTCSTVSRRCSCRLLCHHQPRASEPARCAAGRPGSSRALDGAQQRHRRRRRATSGPSCARLDLRRPVPQHHRAAELEHRAPPTARGSRACARGGPPSRAVCSPSAACEASPAPAPGGVAAAAERRRPTRQPAGQGPGAGHAAVGTGGAAAASVGPDPRLARRSVVGRSAVRPPWPASGAASAGLRVDARRGALEAHGQPPGRPSADRRPVDRGRLQRRGQQRSGPAAAACRPIRGTEHGRAGLRQRVQPQHHLGDQPERAQRAVQQLGQVVAGDVLDDVAAGIARRCRRPAPSVTPMTRSRSAP